MSGAVRLERLVVRRLRVPLQVPYRLSLGTVEAFETLLVEAVTEQGRTGWGEATMLPGYTEERIGEAWRLANAAAPALLGRAMGDARVRAMALHARAPFTATALVSALEMAEGHPVLAPPAGSRVALLAVINASGREALSEEIEQRLAEGYRTLKVKVGFEVEGDLERLAFIQERVGARALLRVDANQGYRRAEAIAFLERLDPAGIELLEQPCAAADWQAAVAVAEAARGRGPAIMLDESIFGPGDIERAADLGCAALIKLKLMKMGGLAALIDGLERIAARGMGAVLGNGVAGDIGCWMEACVAAGRLAGAGEMNGFLKPRTRLFELPVRLEAGALALGPGGVRPDREAIEAHTLEQRDFHAGPAGWRRAGGGR